jgi:hypothetical protein
MDRLAYFKDSIYDLAIEKEALSLTPIIEGAKNIGKSIMNSGLGTKMAVGAGLGGAMGAIKNPGEEGDRLSNAVSGMFGGATAGLTAHGITSGLKPLIKTASDTINEAFLEKVAGVPLSELAKGGEKIVENAVKGADDAGSLANGLKRFYNNTLGANTLKTTVMGAGIGGAAGAMSYKEDQDDGSFGKSRLGAMATGALAGGGAGLAAGMAFKPIKGVPPAPVGSSSAPVGPSTEKIGQFRDLVLDVAMEKKAASIPKTVARGAVNAVSDFKKLDEVYRVAIGSGIGGTIGVISKLQSQKGKDLTTSEKLKTIAKAGFDGAMIGGAVGGLVGFKPGQFKKDMSNFLTEGGIVDHD